MNEVYVVTSGSYSDYRICAVFTDKNLAQKYIDSFKTRVYSDFNEIETYSLNPFNFELQNGYRPYFVRMDRDGNSTECKISDSDYGFVEVKQHGFDVKGNMYIHVFAKDTEHALKITNEKRVQLIANNEWDTK